MNICIIGLLSVAALALTAGECFKLNSGWILIPNTNFLDVSADYMFGWHVFSCCISVNRAFQKISCQHLPSPLISNVLCPNCWVDRSHFSESKESVPCYFTSNNGTGTESSRTSITVLLVLVHLRKERAFYKEHLESKCVSCEILFLKTSCLWEVTVVPRWFKGHLLCYLLR